VTHNYCLSKLRRPVAKFKPVSLTPDEDDDEERAELEESLAHLIGADPASDAEWMDVKDCLDKLEPEERECITLTLGFMLSVREAAEFLGLTPSTVQNRKKSGLEKLRDCLVSKGYSVEGGDSDETQS
jgi:RNA polymerase sigma factor (sigma-70 family)